MKKNMTKKEEPEVLNKTQGYLANKSGQNHEATVESTIAVLANKVSKEELPYVSNNSYCAKPEFENIYGSTKAKADFAINFKGLKIRIECKNQEVPGSVCEKLSFVMDNFFETSLNNFSESVCILVLDGFFYSKNPTGIKAYEYCLKKSKQLNSLGKKQIYVVNGLKDLENILLHLYEIAQKTKA